ncbi:Na+/H+ antiporter MnhB subunit-related protein [Methanocaldococcus infernus ME]|uniref:Na+/H+ antiporter MnhB subunit-related protein n=1 Tax=Methanocaldococcus infernus (strain DSM 11812 / JCM 15783 / ME) TaxID=573063 RepID=D5VSS0_METIM|nr:Na(+)/H(+) antiporter subunit B [Methanocaldococcus infernus]ADG13623.1 Na+/H+ antiporter MnhB subunit-related protein [Methanocaldococcus infernus ME]
MKRDLVAGTSFFIFGASLLYILSKVSVNPGVNLVYLKNYIVPNYVTAVVFDWRAYDTLGECLVLVTAVMISWVIFGKSLYDNTYLKEIFYSKYTDDYITLQRWGEYTEMVKPLALPLSIFMLGLGILTILGGHITPGGGFQGGALIAAAFILSVIAFGSNSPLWFDHHYLEKLEAFGALGYLLAGLFGILVSGYYLFNFSHIFGIPIFPSPTVNPGIIPYLNILVGLKVLAGLSTASFLLSCEKVIIERLERE